MEKRVNISETNRDNASPNKTPAAQCTFASTEQQTIARLTKEFGQSLTKFALCVYVYVCIYICVCACACVYVYVHVCVFVCLCVEGINNEQESDV